MESNAPKAMVEPHISVVSWSLLIREQTDGAYCSLLSKHKDLNRKYKYKNNNHVQPEIWHLRRKLTKWKERRASATVKFVKKIARVLVAKCIKMASKKWKNRVPKSRRCGYRWCLSTTSESNADATFAKIPVHLHENFCGRGWRLARYEAKF